LAFAEGVDRCCAAWAQAAKGNCPFQRIFIETVQAIERELAVQSALKNKAEADKPQMSDIEVARRVAFLLNRVVNAKAPASGED
jgi:hypothetical protein